MGKKIKVAVALALAALLAAALALASCGQGKQPAGSGGQPDGLVNPPTAEGSRDGGLQSTDSVLAELEALLCPEGVDSALWAELKAALKTELAESRPGFTRPSSSGGGSPARLLSSTEDSRAEARRTGGWANHGRDARATRVVATPPQGEANRVNDLAIADNGDGTYTLTWHYRNLGDYDQNGVVGIQDVVPLAQHFGERVFNLNSLVAVIDTRDRGRTSIADIGTIAKYFGTSVSAYDIQAASSKEGPYSSIDTILISEGTGKLTGRLLFSWELLSPDEQMWYRVVPVDGQGNEGVPSIPAIGPEARSRWWTQNSDAQRTGLSEVVGPETPTLKWHYQSGASAFGPPVVAADGTVYVGSFDDSLRAVDAAGREKWVLENMCYFFGAPSITPEGSILAVNETGTMRRLASDGSVERELYIGNPRCTNPILALDGTVYVGTRNEALLALTPEGGRKWVGTYGGTCTGPSITADGRILATKEVGEGQSKWGILSLFTPNRRLVWEFRIGMQVRRSPIAAPDGTIYVVSANYEDGGGNANEGLLHALNEDGTVRWWSRFPVTLFSSFALDEWSFALGEDSSVYTVMRSIDPFGCKVVAYSSSGSELWQSEHLDCLYCRDLLVDSAGSAYVCCSAIGGGVLFALHSDGTLMWDYPLDGSGCLALGDDGALYVATGKGSLYAIGDAGNEE